MDSGRNKSVWRMPLGVLLTLVVLSAHLGAQPNLDNLLLRTSAGSPLRFVSATGQRSFLGGYGDEGFEFWAYPVQIVRNLHVAFRPAGTNTFIDGRRLLSSIETAPTQTALVYVGPGFKVTETLFVPLDRPAAILTFQVQSESAVDIEIRATPVLDLMWPAGMGGQSTAWSDALHAYILSEPSLGFSAAIASPQVVTHDRTGNDRSTAAGGELAFALSPDRDRRAQVFVTLNESRGKPVETALTALEIDADGLMKEEAAHWADLEDAQLQLTTPDPQINRALGWAEAAVHQAWVCNPDLGCGFVGGYGPSHAGRRPQYDWFFAGDGLVAAQAALDAGDWAHARQELEFILRYRDTQTGMIWHELSQSAGLIDWRGKYPYMFVHVDVTFQFLASFARYAQASGDRDFVLANWESIAAAYRYCTRLIDPATALPRIPADKEGANEQDRMADDLDLSVQWIEASEGFALLARQKGNEDLARKARDAAEAARTSIASRYWNPDQQFWINGHTAEGKPIDQMRSGPQEAIEFFGSDRADILLDKLGSADFLTDWGVRSLSSKSTEYDPESYAKGSVWPVATAATATAFWQHHRPAAAYEIWQSLLNVAELDAPGHLHEVLSGAIFAPQAESVPEQSWSSAGLVSSTVQGLLGLETDSLAHRLVFAPSFPGDWDHVEISHIRAGTSSLAFVFRRTPGGLSLAIDNDGPPLQLEFAPLLPLGATLGPVQLNGARLAATLQSFPQETRARMELTVPGGRSELLVAYKGGIGITLPHDPILAGDQSSALRLISTRIVGSSFLVDADASCDRPSLIRLSSGWKLTPPALVHRTQRTDDVFDFTLLASTCPASAYHRVHLEFGIEP